VVTALTPLQAVISPVAIVVAVVVSGAIGLGWRGSSRSAARLDPILALRS